MPRCRECCENALLLAWMVLWAAVFCLMEAWSRTRRRIGGVDSLRNEWTEQ
jgi:hypothetical protein